MKAMLLIALVLAQAAQGRPSPPPVAPHELYQRGIETLDQGEMAEALVIYTQITNENPYHPWAWMGLGWARHYTGDCRGALPAYERALAYGGLPPYRIWQEIARCHVILGEHGAAIDAVRQALASGFPSSERLRTDSRLAALHDLPVFKDLFASAVTSTGSASREDGWRADLDLLAREIARVHYAASRTFGPGELDAAIGAIKSRAGSASDDALTLEVMRLLRRLGDGHTYAEPRYMQRGDTFEGVPLVLEQFTDGVFVTAARPGHEDALWAEVTAVNGREIATVMPMLADIAPQDNAWRPRALAADYLRHPPLLGALGLGDDDGRVRLTLRTADGRVVDRDFASVRGAYTDWIRQPAGETPFDTFARRRDWYWFDRIDDGRTMFVQYNACANKEDERIDAFAARLTAALADPAIERLIVDIRWNGGGNNFATVPLLEAITRAPQNREGRLFVITGPQTFSAAMIFAAQLERYTHAIFVGEPTGASPNFVGETMFVTLPHTGIRVSLSNLYWQTSHATDFRRWIAPMLYVPSRFADIRDGRDAALEAIAAYPR